MIRRVLYYIKNVFFRKHHLINTHLKRSQWHDTDERMLFGMMSLLTDYIEKERAFEVIEWDNADDHKYVKSEILTIRNWWLNRPRRLKDIDDALDKWHTERFKGKDKWLEELNKPSTKKAERLWVKLNKMEADLNTEETDMLIRLIKIREYLWT